MKKMLNALMPLSFILMGMAGEALAKSSLEPQNLDQMENLLAMGFEELANIRLTTASRKDQKLNDVAAAVYVIDQEEIRRSGMTNLAELMRLVPGLDVARIDSSNWAVTSRGFNGQFSNKLLVLMDGRTIYTPLFAGVFWSLQEVMLEDVERIEVIRGPGGTMWGANAVNGVVNIISKKAGETQGGLLSLGVGSLDKSQVGLRYGGRVMDKMAYRLYLRDIRRSELTTPANLKDDSWEARNGGFRIDLDVTSSDSVTMIGNLFHMEDETETLHARGENALLRWTRQLSKAEDMKLQLYYDHTAQEKLEKRTVFDMDFQHRFPLLKNHEIIWGAAYRWMEDTMTNNAPVAWQPLVSHQSTFSVFLQDEIALVADQLRLTVGSKLEHHDEVGWDVQPSARLLWHTTERDTLWASIAHAVRSPSRSDTSFQLRLPTGPTTTLMFSGNPEVQSEKLTAYEVGYRNRLAGNLFVDISVFHNDYKNLMTKESTVSFNPFTNQTTIAQTYANLGVSHANGVETGVDWQVRDYWKVRASHTFLNMAMGLQGKSRDTTLHDESGHVPQHQFQVRSYLDLPNDVALDTALFYIDGLSSLQLPSHLRWDFRLGWKPEKNVALSLVGQNLLDRHHPEFQGVSVVGREIPRSIFAKMELGF